MKFKYIILAGDSNPYDIKYVVKSENDKSYELSNSPDGVLQFSTRKLANEFIRDHMPVMYVHILGIFSGVELHDIESHSQEA